jgi:hypothetical protein
MTEKYVLTVEEEEILKTLSWRVGEFIERGNFPFGNHSLSRGGVWEIMGHAYPNRPIAYVRGNFGEVIQYALTLDGFIGWNNLDFGYIRLVEVKEISNFFLDPAEEPPPGVWRLQDWRRPPSSDT